MSWQLYHETRLPLRCRLGLCLIWELRRDSLSNSFLWLLAESSSLLPIFGGLLHFLALWLFPDVAAHYVVLGTERARKPCERQGLKQRSCISWHIHFWSLLHHRKLWSDRCIMLYSCGSVLCCRRVAMTYVGWKSSLFSANPAISTVTRKDMQAEPCRGLWSLSLVKLLQASLIAWRTEWPTVSTSRQLSNEIGHFLFFWMSV